MAAEPTPLSNLDDVTASIVRVLREMQTNLETQQAESVLGDGEFEWQPPVKHAGMGNGAAGAISHRWSHRCSPMRSTSARAEAAPILPPWQACMLASRQADGPLQRMLKPQQQLLLQQQPLPRRSSNKLRRRPRRTGAHGAMRGVSAVMRATTDPALPQRRVLRELRHIRSTLQQSAGLAQIQEGIKAHLPERPPAPAAEQVALQRSNLELRQQLDAAYSQLGHGSLNQQAEVRASVLQAATERPDQQACAACRALHTAAVAVRCLAARALNACCTRSCGAGRWRPVRPRQRPRLRSSRSASWLPSSRRLGVQVGRLAGWLAGGSVRAAPACRHPASAPHLACCMASSRCFCRHADAPPPRAHLARHAARSAGAQLAEHAGESAQLAAQLRSTEHELELLAGLQKRQRATVLLPLVRWHHKRSPGGKLSAEPSGQSLGLAAEEADASDAWTDVELTSTAGGWLQSDQLKIEPGCPACLLAVVHNVC